MIIKLTLGGLVILLIAVIATSYYVNKEGFDNITSQTLETPANISLAKLQQLFNNAGCTRTLVEGDQTKWWRSRPTVNDIIADMKEYGRLTNSCTGSDSQHNFCNPDKCKKPVVTATPVMSGAVTTGQVNTPTPLLAAVIPQQLASGSTPQRTEVVPEVSLSTAGYDAMVLQQKMDLLKDIQKVVRNELVANRATDPVAMVGSVNKVTDSTAQGKEYEESCYKDTEYKCPKNPDGTCPPIPDMSKYIKKDEIPCWGCAIDY
jgi:hypothetical protein